MTRYGTADARVAPVPDDAYADTLRSLLDHAVRVALCSVFIVDIDPARDPDLEVDDMLWRLRAAAWRGVDARLVVGGSQSNLDLGMLGLGAWARADAIGVPVRLLSAAPRRLSHMKLVIVDDWVLTGSHNWSPGSFSGQIQDSVLAHSPPLAAHLAGRFEQQWRRAAPETET